MKHARSRIQGNMPVVLAVGGDASPELARGPHGPAPLVHVCGLFGYRVDAYPARNLDELRRVIKIIGAVGCLPEFEADPILVHVSVGGDTDGMGIGPDRARWDDLVLMILDAIHDLKARSRPVTLALCAPGGNAQQLAGLLSQHGNSVAQPPDHMFLLVDRLSSATDTILAWTHFYGEATAMDFTADSVGDEPNTQRLCSRLSQLGMGRFCYFHS